MRDMVLKGPDDAVRLWWQLTARKQSPNGCDPFLIKGSVAAPTCYVCGGHEHREVHSKELRGWVDRCKRCGSAWASRIEYVVRGTVQDTRRPLAAELGLVALAVAPAESLHARAHWRGDVRPCESCVHCGVLP